MRSTVLLLSNSGALLPQLCKWEAWLAPFEQNLTQGQVRCLHATQEAFPRLLQSILQHQWMTCGNFS